MKKRILFITLLLLAAMTLTSVLLAESGPTMHLVERGNNAGGCFETATVSGGPIPDNSPAGVCWDLSLGGASSTVVDVNVNVAAAHTWVGDLEFWLNSPDGGTLYMLDRPGVVGQAGPCCGNPPNLLASSPISFFDGAPTGAESMGAGLTTDQIVCQDNGVCDYSPNPDGAAGNTSFADFAGETVSGTWSFCVADNAGLDTGNIDTVTLNVACSAPAVPSLTLTKTVGLDPNSCATTNSVEIPAGQGGTEVTYCYDMTNTGTVTFELHTVVDDQLGTLITNFPFVVPPGTGAYFTVTALITQTTVNSATWTATDATGGNAASASASATVTMGAPTDVSLSSFGREQAALSPIWLATALVVTMGLGLVIRRKLVKE